MDPKGFLSIIAITLTSTELSPLAQSVTPPEPATVPSPSFGHPDRGIVPSKRDPDRAAKAAQSP
jgi:hypothetical protein